MSEFLEVKTHVLAANVPLDIMGQANFFQLFQAPTAVKVEFFKKQTRTGLAEGAPEGFRRGPLTEGNEFDWVRVTSTVNQSVQICRAYGEASLQRIVGTITATLSKSATATDTADVTINNGVTDVIAAAAARRRLIVQAHPDNLGRLRAGPSAAAGRGIIMEPGDVYIFESTAAFQIHNESGAAQKYVPLTESD